MASACVCKLPWLLSIKPHPAQEIPHGAYRRQGSTLGIFGPLAIWQEESYFSCPKGVKCQESSWLVGHETAKVCDENMLGSPAQESACLPERVAILQSSSGAHCELWEQPELAPALPELWQKPRQHVC